MWRDCPVSRSRPDRHVAQHRHVPASPAVGTHGKGPKQSAPKGGKGRGKGRGKGKGRSGVNTIDASLEYDENDDYYEVETAEGMMADGAEPALA